MLTHPHIFTLMEEADQTLIEQELFFKENVDRYLSNEERTSYLDAYLEMYEEWKTSRNCPELALSEEQESEKITKLRNWMLNKYPYGLANIMGELNSSKDKNTFEEMSENFYIEKNSETNEDNNPTWIKYNSESKYNQRNNLMLNILFPSLVTHHLTNDDDSLHSLCENSIFKMSSNQLKSKMEKVNNEMNQLCAVHDHKIKLLNGRLSML